MCFRSWQKLQHSAAQLHRMAHPAVGGDDVAALEAHDVAHDQLLDRQLDPLAVALDDGRRRRQLLCAAAQRTLTLEIPGIAGASYCMCQLGQGDNLA